MTSNIAVKNAEKFHCIICDFHCSKKSNFDKHIMTRKHENTAKMLTNTDTKNAENADINLDANNFICECGKEYKHRQSLHNHKKQCNNIQQNLKDDFIINKDFIMMILKQNQEILKENGELKYMIMDTQNQIIKVIENGNNTTNINNTTTNTNSHNKAFNLNFFLNETCKDAMNIMDFVDSIQLQLSDLEKMGEIGYVEGISNIIVKNLSALDVSKRPVHCTDKKRETIYIKDENKWEKDEEKIKYAK